MEWWMVLGAVLVVADCVIILGPQRAGRLALVVGAFLVPMIDLRVQSNLTFGDLALLGSLVVFVTGWLIRPYRLSSAPKSLGTVLGLIVVGGTIGVVVSGDPVNLASFALAAGSVLVLFAFARPERRTLRVIVWAYSLGAASSGLIGLARGLANQGNRVYGLSGHPNHLALANVLALGGTFALLLTSRRPARYVAMGLMGVHLLLIVMTGSRAGIIAAFVVLVVVAVKIRDRRILKVIIGGGLVLVVVLASGKIELSNFNAIARLTGGGLAAESDATRSERLNTSLNEVLSDPVIGDGFADAHEAHDVPLQLWQGAGILGLFAFLLLVRIHIRGVRRASDPLTVGVWASTFAYVMVSPVVNQLWDRYIWIMYGVAAALVVRQHERVEAHH